MSERVELQQPKESKDESLNKSLVIGMTCLGPITDIPVFLQETAGIGFKPLGVGCLLQTS